MVLDRALVFSVLHCWVGAEVLFGFARLFGGEAKAGGKAVGDDHFLVKLLRTLEWIMNKVTAPFFWILKLVDKRNGT